MRRRFLVDIWSRRAVLALAGAALIAACAAPDGRAPRPQLRFDSLPPLAFDVAEVVTELTYVPPGKSPFVDHRMSLTPSEAAAIWARDRLRAAGDQRRMVFEVSEASVVESIEKGSGGAGLLSMTEVILRYEARMVINVHLYEDSGFEAGIAKVTGERAITIPENAPAVERDAAWNTLLRELMADVDVQLEATLLDVFRDYRAG